MTKYKNSCDESEGLQKCVICFFVTFHVTFELRRKGLISDFKNSRRKCLPLAITVKLHTVFLPFWFCFPLFSFLISPWRKGPEGVGALVSTSVHSGNEGKTASASVRSNWGGNIFSSLLEAKQIY